jgi:hypothetical protein
VSDFVWSEGVFIVWDVHCGADTYLHAFDD